MEKRERQHLPTRLPITTTIAIAIAVTAALPTLVAPPASAVPQHGTPTVEIAVMGGSGCRRETVTIRPESIGFTVRYSHYSATTGGDALPTDFRKNCQLNLRVLPPEGFTYAVSRIDHRGSVRLEPDTTGHFRASHYFAGSPGYIPTRHSFKGPLSGGWLVTEVIAPDRLIYKPCDEQRNLTVSTELILTTSDKTSTNALDMTSDPGTTYHFAWKTCP